MCTYPFAKKALTLYLARSEGHERYFGCNLMQCKVLASSHQHLIAEAPLIGVDDNREILGIENDRLETDDKFMRHLAQAVRNGLGDRAATCIDPKAQIVKGKTICLVSCQRSPEPVYLRWKGLEKASDGDLYVRSGPGTVRLGEEDAKKYVATRFGSK